MNLAEAMNQWEVLRYETERKLAGAFRRGPDGTEVEWKERRALLEKRLSAIAAAMDLLRDPAGPLAAKAVADLVDERNDLVDACRQITNAWDAEDDQELQNGLGSARAAIVRTEAP